MSWLNSLLKIVVAIIVLIKYNNGNKSHTDTIYIIIIIIEINKTFFNNILFISILYNVYFPKNVKLLVIDSLKSVANYKRNI